MCILGKRITLKDVRNVAWELNGHDDMIDMRSSWCGWKGMLGVLNLWESSTYQPEMYISLTLRLGLHHVSQCTKIDFTQCVIVLIGRVGSIQVDRLQLVVNCGARAVESS